MSLIDIEQSKIVGNKGIEKGIDKNAMNLMMDTLQITQYMYPEASTVRELVSNAIDSQKEKTKVIDILTNKSKVEDYWLNREDDKYKDSNFNLNYYSLNCLDQKNNDVDITYIYGEDNIGWCDKFIVKDYGVGLGDKRLEGYFQLGFSSKRNSINQLGGFGLGAKSALSLRNDYFTTISVHNGRKFKFNSYSYKVDSLVPKFNDKGDENSFITFSDGNIVYYEKTNEKNYTEIIVPCKSYHRSKFKDAVENQLLYFSNINFKIQYSKNDIEEIDFKAKIIYNSENLIISEQNQYSKPHILVVKDSTSTECISYGYVNFKEMEMEDLFGAVGFKCPIRQVIKDESGNEKIIQDGIEILPSREGVIWSDHTRNYIKELINKSVIEAKNLIDSNLSEEKDFLIWLETCKNILYNSYNINESSDLIKTIKNISKLIDSSNIKPSFSLDKSISFKDVSEIFWGLTFRKNSSNYNYRKRKNIFERQILTNWNNYIDFNRIYLQDENTSLTKNYYIYKNLENLTFFTIQKVSDERLYKEYKTRYANIATTTLEGNKKYDDNYFNNLLVKRNIIYDFLSKSAKIKSYDKVIVPEDFKINSKEYELDNTYEDSSKVIIKEPQLSLAEQRKLNEEILIYKLSGKQNLPDNKLFVWEKENVKGLHFKNNYTNLYYGCKEDDILLNRAGAFVYQINKNRFFDYDNPIQIVKISSTLSKKLLKPHKHINEFFPQIINNEYKMDFNLVKWNTARLVNKHIKELSFLINYQNFNSDIYDIFQEVRQYMFENYTDLNKQTGRYGLSQEFITEFQDNLNKMTEFQIFVREHQNDSEAIKIKSNELFGIDTLTNSLGYELHIYDKLQCLLSYAQPIKELFNHVEVLTKRINMEFETESLIKEFISLKNLDKFAINVDLLPKKEYIQQEENKEVKESIVETENQ